MKKLKILLTLTSGLIILYGVHFFYSTFILNLYELSKSADTGQKIGHIFNIMNEILLFVALIFAMIGLIKIVKRGFFTAQSSKYFRFGGILFLLVAFGGIIYCLEAIVLMKKPKLYLQRIFTDFHLLVLGLISIIVSDVLKKGSLLKHENDLII